MGIFYMLIATLTFTFMQVCVRLVSQFLLLYPCFDLLKCYFGFPQFFRVVLPLSAPGVVGAALIIFIPTVGDYITPKLVGGTDGLMIANMIQVQFSKANNAPLAAALSVSSLMIVAFISIVFVLVNRKHLRRY